MTCSSEHFYDAVIVGGGFYGCCLALAIRESHSRVALLEKADDLMTRASYANQARVHKGYHYPRSYLTGLRSSVNFPRFVDDFRDCIADSFEHVYAIPRSNSKVSAHQFRKFCSRIDAPLGPAPKRIMRLFNPLMVEDAFVVTEYAFNAELLRRRLRALLEAAGVELFFNSPVERLSGNLDESIDLVLTEGKRIAGARVFNCTYSEINNLLRRSGIAALPLKHEIAEVALVDVPPELTNIGITVVDGAFFSTMPFPARGVHSLTHVRYTPWESWTDLNGTRSPGAYLKATCPQSRVIFMLKDAQRFVPCMRTARHVTSLFEVKTVLLQNEVDDGRPILFRSHYGLPNLSILMGAKIDNIYDALNAIAPSGEVSRAKYATTH